MTRVRLLGLVVAAALVLTGCGGDRRASQPGGRERTGSVAPELGRKLQRALDQQRAFYELPGIAASVVIPEEGTWSGGSGVADRRSGARVTPQTPFAIASITKAFVGALAVKLADDGRVDLDEPLSRTLPDWPDAGQITLRQLLAQRSGVSRFDETPDSPVIRAIDRRPGAQWSPRRVLSYARAPEFRPGRRWQYNNANYLLAGLVLEQATHESVERALRREILDPLRLRDVVLQPDERAPADAAHGYAGAAGRRDVTRGTGYVPYRSAASSAWTSGGMVASAPSVAAFGDAVMRGSLLGTSGRRQLTAFEDTGGEPVYVGYGLGIGQIPSNRLSTPLWGAVGAFPGFGSVLGHLPGKGITVAVLANRDGSTRITVAISEILLETATGRG